MSALASLSYAKPLQIESEMHQLVQLLQTEGVLSYLEIGARYGGSFETIMRSLPVGSRGMTIDLPGGNFGDKKSASILLSAAARLRREGYDITCLFGRSDDPIIHGNVMVHPRFDALMIDGDHSLEAVSADFNAYSRAARIVILHDIAAPPDTKSKMGKPVEVPQFWNVIKHDYRHTEIVDPKSNMGIGVLWMNHQDY